jgi:PAS domain S-box-containing protein
MAGDVSSGSVLAVLAQVRASVLATATSDELRRLLGGIIAEIDRASATLDPAPGMPFSLTPLQGTASPFSADEVEGLRREVERLRVLAENSRGLLESVLTRSPHGILVSDVNGKLILQNRSAERIWAGSATANDVEGWGQYRAFHPDGRPFEAGDWSMARCLRDHATIEAEEVHFQRFDGTHGFLLGSCAPIVGRDGEFIGAVSVFADITQFKQVEEQLRISEAWLSTTLRSIGDAVIATDTEGRVTFMNPVAEELTRWTMDEARGRLLSDVFVIMDRATRTPSENPVSKVLREGAIVAFATPMILIRRDGSELAIDDSGAPIRNDRGDLIGVVLVFRDMTEKSRAEERRELLVEASGLLASTREDPEKTLASLARIAVPRLADLCAIDVLEPEGSLSRLAVAFAKEGKVELIEELGSWYPPEADVPWGVHNVLLTGQSEVLDSMDETMLSAMVRDPEYLEILRAKGARCSMIVPMRAHHRALGAITFLSAGRGKDAVTSDAFVRSEQVAARGSGFTVAQSSYSVDDLALAEELASRAAIALDNALLYREARRAEAEARQNAARMNTLAEVSRAFSEAGIELSAVFSTIARRVSELIGDGCVVRLLSENGQRLEPVAMHHTDPEALSFVRDVVAGDPIPADEGQNGQVVKTGTSLMIERTTAAESRDAVKEEHRAYLDRFGVQSVVIAPLRAPGRTIGTLTVFRDRQGRAFSSADEVLVQDVADRAALAIENARLHHETREAAQAREDLLAIVSHDLRNPLGVVLMSSAILLRSALPDKAGEQVKKQAEKIQRSAERMTSLIANLLDATRIQSGRFPVDFKALDIRQLVSESLDMLKELAAPKSIHLTREIAPNVPLVHCDRERILQVLSNLVGNALKFTPEKGSITVRVAEEDGQALVSVSDTGSGIPDDYVPHIFERYWRGKRDGHGGTGLGLYICKGIVEAHGGRIWLESKIGSGSTFFFTLPLSKEPAPTA